MHPRCDPMVVHPPTWSALICVLLLLIMSPTETLAGGSQQMRSLDEQVQEVKSDVLSIAAELSNLEEKLLYPSDTQIAVFVSLRDGGSLQLDSAEIKIDGELVAAHIYSFKELEALKKGGLQRMHTGNVPTGEHQLDVVIAGKLGGSDISRTKSFSFTKGVGPKLIEVGLSSQDTGAGLISLGRR